MPWTAEQEQHLRQRWAEQATAGMIAAELGGGMSRSAVLGKVHRMKLDPRLPAPKTQYQPRVRVRAARPKVNLHAPEYFGAIVSISTPIPQPTGDPTRYGDMAPDQCRWFYEPFDDVPVMDRLVCSEAIVAPGTSYCAHHHAKVWTKSPPRVPPADRQPVNHITSDPRRRRATL